MSECCVWEEACEWASGMLAKLLVRYESLSTDNVRATIRAVMEALDRESSEKLKAAGQCRVLDDHEMHRKIWERQQAMLANALSPDHLELTAQQRVTAAWEQIRAVLSRYEVGLEAFSSKWTLPLELHLWAEGSDGSRHEIYPDTVRPQ